MQAGLKADMALINGRILTMDNQMQSVEAVAVKGDRIAAVGRNPEIDRFVGTGTTVLDLKGKTALPGFIETHCHPCIGGPGLVYEIMVSNATSISDIIEMIRRKAEETPQGQWIVARRYDDRRLKENRHPTRWDLDKASSTHPIFLKRIDSHLAVVNSSALNLAGVTPETPDPPGGKFDRESETGNPTGVLRDEAQTAVRQVMPVYGIEQTKAGILAACGLLARFGITSFTDAIVTRDGLIAYQELLEEGRLPLRAGLLPTWYYSKGYPGYAGEMKRIGLKAGFGNKWLRIIGTKFSVDGSMSGWTALLNEPYADDPDNRGILIHPEKELIHEVVESHRHGLRPCIHAIGDRAIDLTLDAIEAADKIRPVRNARLRIEHCSLPSQSALQRIKHLGVIPASSIGFIYELGSSHALALGPERIRNYFPHRTYIEMGIIASGNSDWSVTSANVAQQIYGAVTRKSYLGEPIGIDQAISVLDALRLYTINAAYASFEENIKGSIEPGKLADLVALDRDILEMPQAEVKDVQVDTTIVGGKVVYSRPP